MLKRIVLICLIARSLAVYADVTNLKCMQSAGGEYTLSFSLTGDSREVQIFASTDPAGAKDLQPILKTHSTNVTVHAGKPGERMYFFLKPDHGEQREVSI